VRKPIRNLLLLTLATVVCLILAFLGFEHQPAVKPAPPVEPAPPDAVGEQVADTGNEEERFAAILRCWREEVRPDPEVASRPMYFWDGPHGNRIHVPVPVGCQTLYGPPFSEAFLRHRLKADDPLTRRLAGELRLLRLPRLFTYAGQMGAERGRLIECTIVVVQGEGPGIDP
jgi:hypothetical protein